AEDGIRDRTVTGVQTCALPISAAGRHGVRRVGRPDTPAARLELGFARRPALELLVRRRNAGRPHEGTVRDAHARKLRRNGELARSEERRVGKEGKTWGALDL